MWRKPQRDGGIKLYTKGTDQNGQPRKKMQEQKKLKQRWQKKKLTSGSPVEKFVWIRILPIRMSLHTSHTACSMVSPALKMDTPQILLLADRFPWYITPCGVSTTCSCKNSSLLLTICTAAQGVFHPHYNWHKFYWLTFKILCALIIKCFKQNKIQSCHWTFLSTMSLRAHGGEEV